MNPAPTGLPAPTCLPTHEAALARDLTCLGLPPANWPATIPGPNGAPMPDVLVIGAGMLGIAAAAALTFKGIRNIQVLDQSAPGREGPWTSYARMDFLRSPKQLPGPCLGIPALTFRAWYEASHGPEAWERLYKIPNEVWQDYLSWLQRVLALPIRHNTAVKNLTAHPRHIEAHLADGTSIHARRVVLATGRAGAGGLAIPPCVDPALFPDRAAHTNAPYNPAALRGKRVAVLGAGNSAWDHAATALEAGAAQVEIYARRKTLPQINKGRGSANPGFFEGWAALDAAQRWELLVYMNDLQSPPPHESVLRALRQPNLHVHLGCEILAAQRSANAIALTLPTGRSEADFLIVATGFAIDLAREPILSSLHPHIATWADTYTPPAHLVRPELGKFPWLAEDFSLVARQPGDCPALPRIHLFNHGAMASMGQIASDIPGVNVAAERLASRLAQHFAREDFRQLRERLEAFAEPELRDTPFYVR